MGATSVFPLPEGSYVGGFKNDPPAKLPTQTRRPLGVEVFFKWIAKVPGAASRDVAQFAQPTPEASQARARRRNRPVSRGAANESLRPIRRREDRIANCDTPYRSFESLAHCHTRSSSSVTTLDLHFVSCSRLVYQFCRLQDSERIGSLFSFLGGSALFLLDGEI